MSDSFWKKEISFKKKPGSDEAAPAEPAAAEAPKQQSFLLQLFVSSFPILLLIAVPWTAVGTVAFLIVRRRRRERAALPTGVARLVPDSRGARS